MTQHAMQLVAHGVELSDGDRRLIRRAADRLMRQFHRIVEIQVVVRVPHRRLHREVVRYALTIHIVLPQGTITVRRPSSPDQATAIQDAFDRAVRRLQGYVRRRWRRPKAVAGPARGKVARLFRYEGYGFIKGDEGREVYFDRRSVLKGGFEGLEVGSRVRFAPERGREGPQASSVTPGRRPRRSRGGAGLATE